MASVYGWTHQEILSLTARQFFLYLRQISKLEASDQMKRFEASSMPYMEKSDRKMLHERYQDILVPKKVCEEEIDDAWATLRRGSL